MTMSCTRVIKYTSKSKVLDFTIKILDVHDSKHCKTHVRNWTENFQRHFAFSEQSAFKAFNLMCKH